VTLKEHEANHHSMMKYQRPRGTWLLSTPTRLVALNVQSADFMSGVPIDPTYSVGLARKKLLRIRNTSFAWVPVSIRWNGLGIMIVTAR